MRWGPQHPIPLPSAGQSTGCALTILLYLISNTRQRWCLGGVNLLCQINNEFALPELILSVIFVIANSFRLLKLNLDKQTLYELKVLQTLYKLKVKQIIYKLKILQNLYNLKVKQPYCLKGL